MYDICIILCRYLLICPGIFPHDRQWVTFRDLKDSGPLTVYFRDNVEQAIAAGFAGKSDSELFFQGPEQSFLGHTGHQDSVPGIDGADAKPSSIAGSGAF